MPFPLSHWKLNKHFFQQFSLFSLRSLYYQLHANIHVHMQGRVTSFTTRIQFRLFIKEYSTNWYNFCSDLVDMIFGENHAILQQTVSEWRCIKLCAILSEPPCSNYQTSIEL